MRLNASPLTGRSAILRNRLLLLINQISDMPAASWIHSSQVGRAPLASPTVLIAAHRLLNLTLLDQPMSTYCTASKHAGRSTPPSSPAAALRTYPGNGYLAITAYFKSKKPLDLVSALMEESGRDLRRVRRSSSCWGDTRNAGCKEVEGKL